MSRSGAPRASDEAGIAGRAPLNGANGSARVTSSEDLAPVPEPRRASVRSFDVFDTLLVRSCGAPEALFLWLGRRLDRAGVLPCTPEVFARARLRVERAVWEREGGMDARVTLRDFYAELARALRLDSDVAELMVQEELALEERVLRPAPQGRALLDHASASGRRIIFTSDTYFPAAFIRARLEEHALWPEGACCYSSSDRGASKASGALFAEVARDLGVPPHEIQHVGDNLDCDVRAARYAGAHGTWLPEAQQNRYERRLLHARWETAGMGAALAGASRLAREQVAVATRHERALRDVAAGVAGPLLVAYVLWLLSSACDHGLTRLYFAARDGQVLAELATTMTRRLGLPIEIRYLYASRRSLNLAAAYEGEPAELEWACRSAESIPLAAVLRRLGLDLADAESALSEEGFPGCTGATPVQGALRRALWAALQSEGLRRAVQSSARRRRELVVPFLEQELLLDGEPVGIVDVGGVGSQARALHELCVREGGTAPRFFFIGLDAHPDAEQAHVAAGGRWLQHADTFLFDQQRKRGLAPFRGLITSVQLFCAADHGTVLRYEQKAGRIAPVLSSQQDEEVLKWGLPAVRETLRAFAEEVVLDEDLVDPYADLRNAVAGVVRDFARHPTTDEARAWGSFPFEGSEVSAVTRKPLAEPYSWSGVVGAVAKGSALGGSFPNLDWNSWHEGSVAMAPPGLRRALRTVEAGYLRVRRSHDPRARAAMRAARWVRGKVR
jgi:FMN phosphatase YigB (HAD superfamily)